MFVYYATVYAAIQDVIEPRLRGIAVALYFCFMYILGASVGPLGNRPPERSLCPQGHDGCGRERHDRGVQATGLHNAMYIIPILALAAAAVLFAASRTMDKDVRKQELSHTD